MNNSNNILIKRKIKILLKDKNLKANNKIIDEIGNHVQNFLTSFLDSLSYNLKIEGRKVVREEDLSEAIKNLERKKDFFEI